MTENERLGGEGIRYPKAPLISLILGFVLTTFLWNLTLYQSATLVGVLNCLLAVVFIATVYDVNYRGDTHAE